MRTALLVLILTLSTSIAAAQPSMAPISDPEEPARIARIEADAEISGTTATALAVTSTLAGFGVTIASARYGSSGGGFLGMMGILVGPSAGHIYAGEGMHAFGTSLLRSAGAAVMFLGVVQSLTTDLAASCTDGCGGHGSRGKSGGSLIALGGAVYLITAIYDIYDAHHAARRANREHAMTVVPTLPSQGQGLGLAVAGRF